MKFKTIVVCSLALLTGCAGLESTVKPLYTDNYFLLPSQQADKQSWFGECYVRSVTTFGADKKDYEFWCNDERKFDAARDEFLRQYPNFHVLRAHLFDYGDNGEWLSSAGYVDPETHIGYNAQGFDVFMQYDGGPIPHVYGDKLLGRD